MLSTWCQILQILALFVAGLCGFNVFGQLLMSIGVFWHITLILIVLGIALLIVVSPALRPPVLIGLLALIIGAGLCLL